MSLAHDAGRSVRAVWRDPWGIPSPGISREGSRGTRSVAPPGGTELLRYVYAPRTPRLESPRPYFHPLRTLRGDLVSLYRPHDHIWHKGIAWSLPNVGTANFWGGPTYNRGHGYRQLPNDGTMRHDGFDLAAARDGVMRLDERLTWITEQGETWFHERRRIGATAWPEAGAWVLAFETTMRNVSGTVIRIGSPTTEGRENAGYGGLFWRGPRSFTSGRVVTPDGEGGDEYMGWRGPWLGFAGKHDGHGRASTLVFRDFPGNFSFPSQWFVRSGMFACLCPAPFFSEEFGIAEGSSVKLRYDVAIADGGLGIEACGRLAERMGAGDLLATPGGSWEAAPRADTPGAANDRA